ncbi:MAG: type II toxin-antitoxin system VapC family toxin [Parcubacteria group bacterium]|nr:type II toxin-antitoxin system VapC family toxin [Parcubacteria group bacterium]
MVLLDSSVWVALFHDDDSQHERAIKIVDEIDGKIGLPHSIAFEVANVLTYKASKATADAFLFHAINNRDIEIMPDNFIAGSFLFLETKKQISLTDVSLVVLAKQNKYDLFTFDKQMEGLFRTTKVVAM